MFAAVCDLMLFLERVFCIQLTWMLGRNGLLISCRLYFFCDIEHVCPGIADAS